MTSPSASVFASPNRRFSSPLLKRNCWEWHPQVRWGVILVTANCMSVLLCEIFIIMKHTWYILYVGLMCFLLNTIGDCWKLLSNSFVWSTFQVVCITLQRACPWHDSIHPCRSYAICLGHVTRILLYTLLFQGSSCVCVSVVWWHFCSTWIWHCGITSTIWLTSAVYTCSCPSPHLSFAVFNTNCKCHWLKSIHRVSCVSCDVHWTICSSPILAWWLTTENSIINYQTKLLSYFVYNKLLTGVHEVIC